MAEKTTACKMTEGPISRQILLFAVPLMIGNLFQMLYNSVDSIVVGNFVSTEALAAIGATTMIVNIAVFFFNGFSTGAGVVIARNYGAGKMEERSLSIRERIRNEIVRVKEEVGHVPTRMDLFTCMQDDLYEYCYGHAKENPFCNYLAYLHENHCLTPEEEKIYQNETAEGFLNLLETTSMSKVYKTPVLMTFCNHGKPLMEITDEQVLKTWKEFFTTGTNWKDLNPGSGREAFLAMTDHQNLTRIHQMPIKFLLKSGNGYFTEKEGYALALNDSLRPFIDDPVFIAQFHDIIEYRAMSYYRSRYLKKQHEHIS